MTDTESDRAVVEQAKGALMLRYGITSFESLAAMARWAREAHVTLHEVAHALVTGICLGQVTPETQEMVRWLEQRLRAGIGEAPQAPDSAREVVLRPSTVAAHTPVPAPRSPARAGAATPQWRYTSAVHAARALSSP